MKQLLPLALLALAFYFLVLRPSRRQKAKAEAISSSLAPGAEVLTAGGMRGTVVSLDDDDVVLDIAPGVPVRFVRGAIRKVISPADVAADESSDDETVPIHPSDPPEPTT